MLGTHKAVGSHINPCLMLKGKQKTTYSPVRGSLYVWKHNFGNTCIPIRNSNNVDRKYGD